jgi:hypothetical protein
MNSCYFKHKWKREHYSYLYYTDFLCLVFIHVRTVSENKNKTYKSWRIFFSFYDHVLLKIPGVLIMTSLLEHFCWADDFIYRMC